MNLVQVECFLLNNFYFQNTKSIIWIEKIHVLDLFYTTNKLLGLHCLVSALCQHQVYEDIGRQKTREY